MSEVVPIRTATTAAGGGVAAPASAPDGGTSFSAALAKAGTRPKGERTEKVQGHRYLRIVAGPDKGDYLNRSGNARNGDAFRIVQRGGRTFHVYGSGGAHAVFAVPDPSTGGAPAA
jgi:hypothetical protein